MVEFALVTPVLMLLIMGLLEAGLLMFSASSANFAAAEGARAEAEKGNAADADSFALAKIRTTILGTTQLLQVNEIDIFRVVDSGGGNFTVDVNSDMTVEGCASQCINRYYADGTAIGPLGWDVDLRKVTNAGADFLAVQIDCQYNWYTGIPSQLGPVILSPVYYVRLEPQTY